MKKFFIAIFAIIIIFLTVQYFKNDEKYNFTANTSQASINIYFFYGDGCPHCSKEGKFLASLQKKYPEINIKAYEVWHDRENIKTMREVAEKLNFEITGVPFTIIGDKTFSGYYDDKTTGAEIEKAILDFLKSGCSDIVGPIINKTREETCEHGCNENDEECFHNCGCSADVEKPIINKKINLPLLGEINPTDFSLPLFTIIIAAIDGFNPCAMWVLLFLISLLLGMEDKFKMWTLGAAFIASSGLVYFLFLSAWLNLFLFIGLILWIRLIIGAVALGSGGYHIMEYLKNPKGLCHVSENTNRKKVFEKIRNIISKKNFWLALGGIIILAAAVNLVELVCSAGLPAVYTQVLALSNLPIWKYYAYLILYIFIFMLDDLLIFIIAMKTLQLKSISTKYTHWANLAGGIIMIIIGLLLIFKPGWLMFG